MKPKLLAYCSDAYFQYIKQENCKRYFDLFNLMIKGVMFDNISYPMTY